MAAGDGQLGRYEVLGTLGRGGFATVYRARDTALGRIVALKALLPHLTADAGIRERFLAESRALANLRHPNVVTVYDVGEADGRPFFAMELVPGTTLEARLAGGATLSPAEVARVLGPLASALDAVHAAGLVHRDVKPANVLIEPSGRVVLMDLGIALSVAGASHTLTGVSLGTPSYMSPEQVRGERVTPASDIYALGVLTYQMLAGRTPFSGDTAHVLHAQVYEPVPPLAALRPDLPPRVYAAVDAALAKDAAPRPRSAAAFASLLMGVPIDALPPVHASDEVTAAHVPATQELAAQPATAAPPAGPDTSGAMTEIATASMPPRRGGNGAAPSAVRGRGKRPWVAGAVAVLLFVAACVAIVVLALHGRSSHAARATNIVAVATPRSGSAAAAATVRTPAPAASVAATLAPAVGAYTGTPQTSAASLSVSAFTVAGADGWMRGQNALQGCATYTNAPAGSGLRVRVSAAGDPGDALSQSDLLSLPAPAGRVCVDVLSIGAVRPGNYVALLYDERWQQQGSYAFIAGATPPTAAPPRTPPTQTSTAPAGLPPSPSLAFPASVDPSGPTPRITAVTAMSGASANGVFVFTVSAINGGLAGGTSSISVSSPDALQLEAEIGPCDVTPKPVALPPGSNVTALIDGQVGRATTSQWLAEIDTVSWPAGARCTLTVAAHTPPSGSVTFLIRATIVGADGRVATWPQAAPDRDQQGFPAVRWTVPLQR